MGRFGDQMPAVARTPRQRLLGLSFLDLEDSPGALLIPRCRSVHTIGMRFDLDIWFLDDEGRAIRAVRRVPPRRLASCPGAVAVLEVPSPRTPGTGRSPP